MEAADPFATQPPGDEGDPFAEVESDASAAETDAPTVPADAPEPPPSEPPIVNREGERVDGQQEAAAPEAPAAPAEPPAAEQQPEEAAQPPEGGGAEQEPPEEPQTAGGEQPQQPEQPAAQAPPAQQPTEPAGDNDKSRRYKLLYQTGPNQWTEAPLENAPDGTVDTEEKDGVVEKWLLARNTDHARRLAWTIFGRPEQGVTVVPVAASSWKPRRVRKAAPQPDRERLEIV